MCHGLDKACLKHSGHQAICWGFSAICNKAMLSESGSELLGQRIGTSNRTHKDARLPMTIAKTDDALVQKGA